MRGKCNQPRLITLVETLIILDITKTEFNYCLLTHCFMENIQKLLCEVELDFICASKNTRTNAPSDRITRNHSSARAISFPESSFPLTSGRQTRALGATILK